MAGWFPNNRMTRMSPAAPVKASLTVPRFCNQFYLLGITMIAALLLANAAAWILLAMALIIVR